LFEGWVEEVDSGKELRFHSLDELLGFLGQRFRELPLTNKDIVIRSGAPDEEQT
jgi:hypothetical protein